VQARAKLELPRQGIYQWEINVTYHLLEAILLVGFIRYPRPVPEVAYENNKS